LALSLSFTTVFAAEETDSAPPSEVETLTEEPVTEPETEKVDLKKQIVPESEVPDLIDYDIAMVDFITGRSLYERALRADMTTTDSWENELIGRYHDLEGEIVEPNEEYTEIYKDE
ncbi:MAG: hypothetical protein J6C26_06045, partial [Clostridia bacterium]|nr:hypothetical protein [Clostridia bacterium]